ncbi:hypothetical protein B0H67DRAFT_102885 [Lasiosphaeris hirsuta]|uniref:Uncharacterized protein n=1 Tax=Lasiosphaeris hirsuta TaxID=260670 RepID=A0AA40AYH2_9PEZI|nr:hypothetical protein B0H67DRAFT_102885 [Lasiosphaeris hirsuta]
MRRQRHATPNDVKMDVTAATTATAAPTIENPSLASQAVTGLSSKEGAARPAPQSTEESRSSIESGADNVFFDNTWFCKFLDSLPLEVRNWALFTPDNNPPNGGEDRKTPGEGATANLPVAGTQSARGVSMNEPAVVKGPSPHVPFTPSLSELPVMVFATPQQPPAHGASMGTKAMPTNPPAAQSPTAPLPGHPSTGSTPAPANCTQGTKRRNDTDGDVDQRKRLRSTARPAWSQPDPGYDPGYAPSDPADWREVLKAIPWAGRYMDPAQHSRLLKEGEALGKRWAIASHQERIHSLRKVAEALQRPNARINIRPMFFATIATPEERQEAGLDHGVLAQHWNALNGLCVDTRTNSETPSTPAPPIPEAPAPMPAHQQGPSIAPDPRHSSGVASSKYTRAPRRTAWILTCGRARTGGPRMAAHRGCSTDRPTAARDLRLLSTPPYAWQSCSIYTSLPQPGPQRPPYCPPPRHTAGPTDRQRRTPGSDSALPSPLRDQPRIRFYTAE